MQSLQHLTLSPLQLQLVTRYVNVAIKQRPSNSTEPVNVFQHVPTSNKISTGPIGRCQLLLDKSRRPRKTLFQPPIGHYNNADVASIGSRM